MPRCKFRRILGIGASDVGVPRMCQILPCPDFRRICAVMLQSGGFHKMTRMKSAPGAFIVALAFTLGLSSRVHADPIRVTYSTTGVVGATSLDGSPVLY